ncbi:FUSC family protein [Segnochrobactraceae bacterium EtOH-i3]
MAVAADASWRGIARQTLQDIKPFPGRFGMTWRVALLCALVAGVAMLYKIPESAIGCYLIIYLMRPDGAENVGQALGIIVLASVVVLGLSPVIQATADNPMMRIFVIAGVSFALLFLGSISQLGENASIVALVIAFILTLVDLVPAGEIVTRGLLYAWQMACVPMMMMIVFSLVLGTGPHTLLRRTIAERLRIAAEALEATPAEAARLVDGPLSEGAAEPDKQALLAGLFHTVPATTQAWLSGASRTTYRLLLAISALPATVPAETRADLAARCRGAADIIAAGGRPPAPVVAEAPVEDAASAGPAPVDPAATDPLVAIRTALDGLSGATGGSDEKPVPAPFFRSDAFTNPDHQRFALKTTAAAIICYLVYRMSDWSGIHTAMVTCYVAALGSTGETVHKLALRITGCLIGAAIGFFCILFVIPHLESVGGLMVMVFCAILVAAWVSTGNERVSYGGVQIGLAFLLTILDGFAPSTSLDSARDRIIGILLGNTVMWVIFTQIWPKSAIKDVRERLSGALAGLSRLAALDPAARRRATGEAALVAADVGHAREVMALLPFEPRSNQPSPARVIRARRVIAEIRALLPALMFAPAANPQAAAALTEAAGAMAGPSAEPAPAPPGEQAAVAGDVSGSGDDLAGRARRLARMAAR